MTILREWQIPEKNLMSVIFPPHNSRAGNGCANFMGAWDFLVLSTGKPVKFLVLLGGEGWGGECQVYFLGARLWAPRSWAEGTDADLNLISTRPFQRLSHITSDASQPRSSQKKEENK